MGKHMQTVAAMACMKTLLLVFNLVFWLSGWAILAIAIYMKERLHIFMELTGELSDMTIYVLIATGVMIIVISSLACCCTVKGQHVLLYVVFLTYHHVHTIAPTKIPKEEIIKELEVDLDRTYGAFLAIAFVMELGTGLSVYAYRERFPAAFDQGLNQSMAQYYNNSSEKIAVAIDTMQNTLKCCGNHGPTDWIYLIPPKAIPASCCIKPKCDTADSAQIFSTGCYDTVVKFINENVGALAGVAIGITFFPIAGVILSCCLASIINKTKYEQMN